MAMDRSAFNITALVKEATIHSPGERWVFLYDDTEASANATIQVIGRFAGNPDLSLTWDDAAVLARKIRAQVEQRQAERKTNSDINQFYPRKDIDP